jgi:Protein of unknown function (DUF4056)
MRALWFLAMGVGVGGAGCLGPTWQSEMVANGVQVAQALDDPMEIGQTREFDPASVPLFKAPTKLRPCCVFGMDLKAKLGALPMPVNIPNVTAIEELGPHGYDNGKIEGEHNGLVYTCRGGFIDVAHIRDNADRMLFIVTQIARGLPGPVSFDLPEEGTTRRVNVKALPDGMLERRGRWATATALGAWVNFQMSVWHEVITWYDWETIKGFSEKVSAFSIEDLYSNVLGARIAAGIITNRETRSRDEYDAAMDAWIAESLRRLGAVSRDEGRQAMKAVDGLWWDSTKFVTENKLVIRRYFNTTSPLSGWRVTEAVPDDASMRKMCAGRAPPLALEVPEHLGKDKIEDLVSLDFAFTSWIPEGFPVPATKGSVVHFSDFPAIIADAHRKAEREFGPGFDRPGPRPAGETQEKVGRVP